MRRPANTAGGANPKNRQNRMSTNLHSSGRPNLAAVVRLQGLTSPPIVELHIYDHGCVEYDPATHSALDTIQSINAASQQNKGQCDIEMQSGDLIKIDARDGKLNSIANGGKGATADGTPHHLHHLSVRRCGHFQRTINLNATISRCALQFRVARQKRQ